MTDFPIWKSKSTSFLLLFKPNHEAEAPTDDKISKGTAHPANLHPEPINSLTISIPTILHAQTGISTTFAGTMTRLAQKHESVGNLVHGWLPHLNPLLVRETTRPGNRGDGSTWQTKQQSPISQTVTLRNVSSLTPELQSVSFQQQQATGNHARQAMTYRQQMELLLLPMATGHSP